MGLSSTIRDSVYKHLLIKHQTRVYLNIYSKRTTTQNQLTQEFQLYDENRRQRGGEIIKETEPEASEEYGAKKIEISLTEQEFYFPYQGELLAVIWDVKTFRLYLQGVKFTLVTDHQPLQWLFSRKESQGQATRWILLLQDFDFEIKHRPGVQNGNAYALPRLPLQQEDQADLKVPIHLASLISASPPLAHQLLMVGERTAGHSPSTPPPSLIYAGRRTLFFFFFHHRASNGLLWGNVARLNWLACNLNLNGLTQ